MTSTAVWRQWRTTWEWEGTVAPDLRDRLDAFLTYLHRAAADLAATVADATDGDLIFLLSSSLLWMDGDPIDRAVIVEAWRDTATPVAESTQLTRWIDDLESRLAPERPVIQAAAVMLLLERVFRALLATGTLSDSAADSVERAADHLEAQLVGVLKDVRASVIPPSTYRMM